MCKEILSAGVRQAFFVLYGLHRGQRTGVTQNCFSKHTRHLSAYNSSFQGKVAGMYNCIFILLYIL